VVKSGTAFEVLARNTLDDNFDASPALAGNVLYLRGYKSLYALEEK
jgi:outer membrane protein assembly factor BamB